MFVLKLTANERTYLVDLLYAPATVRDAPDDAVEILRDLSSEDSRSTWEALNDKLRNAEDEDLNG